MKTLKLFTLAIVVLCHFGCVKTQFAEPATNSSNHLKTAKLMTSAAAVPGDLADGDIKYFGRWDFSNPAEYASYWGGAYFRVNFTGTTARIKVGYPTHYYAKIDDGPWISYYNASGTINLTPVPLSNGTHTLTVAQGKDYDYIFKFQGLLLDAGASTSTPPVQTALIEWIGDSITAGYTDEQANVSGYGWVCSEQLLHTEHTQIAYPGIRLVSGDNGPGMDVQYFKLQNPSFNAAPAWDFTRYTPKLIVINLGTNDNGHVPEAQFRDSYVTFLANIRTKFSDVEIFVMRTFNGYLVTPTVAAVNARIAAGDTKVHYIDTNGWLTGADYTDGLHPSVAGNIKAANLLQPILQPYLTGNVSNGVTFYQDTDYGGPASQVLPVGNYTIAQLAARGMPNDWASSVKVPAGRTLIMYADDNFSGTSWTRTSDTPNFTTLSPNANDLVSSIRVQ